MREDYLQCRFHSNNNRKSKRVRNQCSCCCCICMQRCWMMQIEPSNRILPLALIQASLYMKGSETFSRGCHTMLPLIRIISQAYLVEYANRFFSNFIFQTQNQRAWEAGGYFRGLKVQQYGKVSHTRASILPFLWPGLHYCLH